MPKVAVLTNRIGSFVGISGGGSAMREKLCEALRDEGHELRLFAAGLHDSADVGITDYSPMLIPSWRTLRAIWGMVKESDLLIVSGSFSPCLPFGVAASRLLGVKTLVIFTTDSDKVVNAYYGGLSRVLWWQMYSWCDRMVAGLATRAYARTEDFMQKLETLHGIRCMGVMTMDDQYKRFAAHIPDPSDVLQHTRSLLSGGRPDLPLLLYADRWAPEKRIELLAANRPPGMVLAIVNPIQDEAKDDMISALHDPANGIVCLPTFIDQDQLRVYYKAADVVVSASDFENTGHTAHEALLCGTPVVLQRTGGFISQVEEGKQGFLVDWTNPDDVQIAIYKALALRHSGVRPRHHPCSYEGTDIVREMLAADVPGILPRSAVQWVSLIVWAARLPFLLILLSIYVVFPDVWPHSNRHSDYINFGLKLADDEELWEDEERRLETRSSLIGNKCDNTRRRSSFPVGPISLVAGISSILLMGLLVILFMSHDAGTSLGVWRESALPAQASSQVQLTQHARTDFANGRGVKDGGDTPCQLYRIYGDWVGSFMAFSAGVALPLTILCSISVGLLLVVVCILLTSSSEKLERATARRSKASMDGYGQPLRAHDVGSRFEPGCNRIWLFDTTLRDGGQTRGVDFSVADKISIAKALDDFGVDYIEGGWPGANPTDTLFFSGAPKSLQLEKAKLVAFGMTRRAACRAADDPGLTEVLRAPTHATCIFGKTWDFQVKAALKVSLEENLAMISDSVRAIVAAGREPMFDCEHFFDGYKANPDYAVACARAAHEAGANWVILCDTNGGTMPDEVHRIVSSLRTRVKGIRLGIHCHNDCGLAVANSLAAVAAGARQIQGTINGLGERCGNADLVTIVANLSLKTDFEMGVSKDKVRRLKQLSRMLDQRLGRAPNQQAPYVGDAAFAHKGGVHASAVQRDPRTYEHVVPDQVGNERQFVVSNQSGRSNVLARIKEMGIGLDAKDARVGRLIDEVKAREFEGWSFDRAEASFDLLVKRVLKEVPFFFRVASFRVVEERRQARIVYDSSAGHAFACADTGHDASHIEATVRLESGTTAVTQVCSGASPVAAVENALRTSLREIFPGLDGVRLRGYQVRTLSGASCSNAYGAAEAAASSGSNDTDRDADSHSAGAVRGVDGSVVRVLVECEGGPQAASPWRTVAVSGSVLDAFVLAYCDAMVWCLLQQTSCPGSF